MVTIKGTDFFATLKRIFVTGLAAIVPLGITIYVIGGLFYFADGILGRLINKFLYRYLGYTVPGLGIVIAVLIIFLAGMLIRLSRMRLFRWIERMFFRIPLVNKIYFPVKQIFDFLFFSPQYAFKSAVLLEYPRKGVYTLGFITNENSFNLKKAEGQNLQNVFIPSSPSPLTGFIVMAKKGDLIHLDLGVDEAIKLIVSGGLLMPLEK
ncbi:MAG: DUF502 domain-containing protein [Candidatus Omnitrophica bacterium]|nr:DUF502 domain-containing protein [Candidatus Omnitrophota bacterium]MBD3268667.1 DUF502 domain-containing protein [Candidatus Omnitrophota bacterium]